MPEREPFFPTEAWDGRSASRGQGLKEERSPDKVDWEQGVAEIKAIENYILNHPGGSGVALSLPGKNKDTVAFAVGTPLAMHSSGTGFVRADASDNLHNCIGLATVGAAPDGTEVAQLDGPVILSDWTAVTGSTALAPRGVYFLSDTPGMLTTDPPSTPGKVIQLVGDAVSDQALELRLTNSILL
jgi:hypothetical protein